ncbi:hypothetical protein VPH35_056675 [Triticum aestivum]
MAGAEGLPSDLLGEIYRRCASVSPYDRARFAAVCTSWRAVASSYPKLPALPLLLPSTDDPRRDLPTRPYSPEDGRVLRAPLPCSPPRGMRIVGSYDGGWVAATGGSQVMVVNLFTRAQVLLPGCFACRCPKNRLANNKLSIEKIIFSKDPTLKGCILAAITTRCIIGLCNPRSQNIAWTTRGCDSYLCSNLTDIAFCNGELYGLSRYTLYRLVLGRKRNGAPIVTSVYDLATRPNTHAAYAKYVFDLRGKLAIAVEIRNHNKTLFRIFRLATYLDKSGTNKYLWFEVASLGDNALFLGPGCCKAVHVAAVGKGGGVEANRIYYSSPDVYVNCSARLDLGSCDVYCWESDDVHRSDGIMSRGYHYRDKDDENSHDKKDGNNSKYSCMWVLPPDF